VSLSNHIGPFDKLRVSGVFSSLPSRKLRRVGENAEERTR